jgi:nifR3 family TIM-barrel protein
MKMRIGVDDTVHTFLPAGRIAADAGVAAIALHARTAAQHYSGTADWDAIAQLKAHVTDVPVLGNGDIWRPTDALAMIAATGCDGVVVGRGCLGRPWIFRDIALAAQGVPPPGPPPLGDVLQVLRHHAELLIDWLGEQIALRDLRKHVPWYFQGYPVGGDVRRSLATAQTLVDLDAALAPLDPTLTQLPGTDALPRGKTSGPQPRVALPANWLDNADDPTPDVEDELTPTSGG